MRNILCFIVVFIVVAGCSEDKALRHRLEQAEALMDSRPDSSLVLLDSINPDMLGSDENRALYALLYSQARDKNYIDITDDSLISVATRYYAASSDTRRAMFSFYYKACVLFNASDYPHAIISALEAEKLARQLDDKPYLARIEWLMGDIYDCTYNFKEEIIHRGKVSTLYKDMGYNREYLNSLVELSRAYINDTQYERGIKLLDSISSFVENTRDSTLIVGHIKSYALAYIYSGEKEDYGKAKTKFEDLRRYGNHYQFNKFDYSNMAAIFLKEGKIDSASLVINYAITNLDDKGNNMSIKNASYLLAKEKGDIAEALRIHEDMFSIDDSLTRFILGQSAISAHKDYYRKESIIQQSNYRNMKIYYMFSIIIMVLIVGGIGIIYRERLKRKDIEIESKINEIQAQEHNMLSLSEKLGGQEMRTSQLSELVNKLFADRFATINLLCNEFFERRDSDKVKYSIYERVKAEVLKFSEPKEMAKLEKVVNQCKDNIASKLRKEFPNMNEGDITFLIMIFAGLNQRAISIFMDIQLGNYYNKRHRLKAKIAASDSKYKHLFLSNIDK